MTRGNGSGPVKIQVVSTKQPGSLTESRWAPVLFFLAQVILVVNMVGLFRDGSVYHKLVDAASMLLAAYGFKGVYGKLPEGGPR